MDDRVLLTIVLGIVFVYIIVRTIIDHRDKANLLELLAAQVTSIDPRLIDYVRPVTAPIISDEFVALIKQIADVAKSITPDNVDRLIDASTTLIEKLNTLPTAEPGTTVIEQTKTETTTDALTGTTTTETTTAKTTADATTPAMGTNFIDGDFISMDDTARG